MIIIREKKQPLEEMARFKGMGIILEVRSNHHGKFGNKESPAHAHVLDNAGKEIGQIVITRDAPKKPSDIIWYKTDSVPKGVEAAVIKLANSQNQVLKKTGANEIIWRSVINQWFYFHEE